MYAYMYVYVYVFMHGCHVYMSVEMYASVYDRCVYMYVLRCLYI